VPSVALVATVAADMLPFGCAVGFDTCCKSLHCSACSCMQVPQGAV
jgi:hypothetical protein